VIEQYKVGLAVTAAKNCVVSGLVVAEVQSHQVPIEAYRVIQLGSAEYNIAEVVI
jgi:hypothetical protein